MGLTIYKRGAELEGGDKEWGTVNLEVGGGGSQFYSRDFNFGIKILNLISTPHKHSFFIVTNVLSLSRDLPHPF